MTGRTMLIVLLAGCADLGGTVDPSFGLPDVVIDSPTFAHDVAPLLQRRCAIGGCHSVATHQANLTLAPGFAFDNLVNHPSRLQPAALRVAPGSASASWIMAMIGPDPARRNGFSRMPLASSPLTPNQIATIARWIDRGAPRN